MDPINQVTRRILALRYRDFEGGPRACFVHSILNLGARHELLLFHLYDPFLNYRGNSVDAHRYIALEHRFLMSSDLYEKPGLVGMTESETS